MSRRNRTLAAAIAVTLLAGAFASYGWWTRRGGITYDVGGAFGSIAGTSVGGSGAPAPGLYTYRATGEESVKLGPLSACSWPVNRVEIAVRHEAAGTVLDQTIGERVERTIYDYGDDGAALTFTASTVTCLGIRTTSEDTLTPPAMRFRRPLLVADTWTTTATTEHRTEDATVRIERRSRITVPAGTFDATIVHLDARFSGGQDGRVESTFWFSEELGIWIKQRSMTTADRSGARFSSSYTAELVSFPDAR